MYRATVLLAIAIVMVGYGVFGFDRTGTTTRPSYFVGLALMAVSLVLLIRSGWRGSAGSWLVGAAGTAVATWAIYELVRQSVCPLIDDPAARTACLSAWGVMTAPVLSYVAGGLVLLVGWLRLRRLARDPERR